ncbi:hypothetical protein DPMN_021279 [Dreissena polymorpha]|uniref:Uncharacterized protein n=1 Tax=Dreissena polymorpha TaxID=45954 RepID=A0A9D4NKH0_DREPO|nr:hypothetical protein DPMN_021279 [Dreissena polymorpha]
MVSTYLYWRYPRAAPCPTSCCYTECPLWSLHTYTGDIPELFLVRQHVATQSVHYCLYILILEISLSCSLSDSMLLHRVSTMVSTYLYWRYP